MAALLFISHWRNNEDDGFLETSVEGAFAEQSRQKLLMQAFLVMVGLITPGHTTRLAHLAQLTFEVNGVGLFRDIDNIASSSFA